MNPNTNRLRVGIALAVVCFLASTGTLNAAIAAPGAAAEISLFGQLVGAISDFAQWAWSGLRAMPMDAPQLPWGG